MPKSCDQRGDYEYEIMQEPEHGTVELEHAISVVNLAKEQPICSLPGMIAVACAAGASVADPARSLMLRACCIKNVPPRGYCARGAEKIMIEASAEVSKGGLTNETAPADKSCIVGSGSHVRVRSILAFAVARGGCAEGHDQGPARRKLDNRFDYDARRCRSSPSSLR
jgi:hypothetical protein